MTKIDPPFLVAGDVTTGETKVLQLAVQGDTRYELSIENGGWYEPCYVVRYLGVYVAHSNGLDWIVNAAKVHKLY